MSIVSEIPRRRFLRGLGCAMALPMLDSMALGRAPRPPQRLAFLFVPNGVHRAGFVPAKEGELSSLPSILASLKPHRGDFSVLSGLDHNNARALGDGPGDHARSAACFLTGAHPRKTSGSDIHVGVSVDQVAAKTLGVETRFASLELGCEAGRQSGGCDSGYSCAYSSSISWRSAHQPMTKEINPKAVFDRLFLLGAQEETDAHRDKRLRLRKSLLDFVQADRRSLLSDVGARDRRKLDEYFEAVREIEQRVDRAQKGARKQRSDAGMDRPAGVPEDYGEHVRLMLDLIAMAFRLDLTRVVSFMYANEGSNRSYPSLGINGGHHYLSHHGNDPAKLDALQRINTFQIEQFAHFLKTLDGAREGAGSLLDSTAVMWGAGIGDGNRHDHGNLPTLLAGRGAGHRPGRHRRYAQGTPMCDLYVSLLQGVGAPAQQFGDSKGSVKLG